MAVKVYGNLAGQPVQALMSGRIGIVPTLCKDSRDVVLSRDYLTLAGAVIGDQVSLGFFRSAAWLDLYNSTIISDALGAGATLNVGDAAHPAGLAGAINVAGAGFHGLANFVPANIASRLWQLLGYAADPGGMIELLATFAGANPANVGFAWEIVGQA